MSRSITPREAIIALKSIITNTTTSSGVRSAACGTRPRDHAIRQHHYEKQRNDRWGQLHHPDLDGLRHQLGSGDNYGGRRATHKSQQ
jgi:ABC-type phosphonate transport system ATPase subunit